MVKRILATFIFFLAIHGYCQTTSEVSHSAKTSVAHSPSLITGSTCANPIVIPSLPYSGINDTEIYGNNITNTQPGSSCGVISGNNFLASNDVVYAYTAEETGNIMISMTPESAPFSGVFVYGSCEDIGLNCIAGSGNQNSNTRLIPSVSVTAGQRIYIVISALSTIESFKFNLIVQKVTCPQPRTLAVSTSFEQTSATASWVNGVGSTATSWEIAVQTANTNIPPGNGTPTSDNSGYVFNATSDGTPLNAGMRYQYWVRANCGNDSYSAWSGPFLFTMPICATSNQCNYTFRISGYWNYGGRMQVKQNGSVVATLGATSTGATINVTVPLCNNVPFELFWNEPGVYPEDMDITIINSFSQQIYVMPVNSSGLVGTTLFSAMVDCLHPACEGQTTAPNVSAVTYNSATIGWLNSGSIGKGIYVAPLTSPAPDINTPPTYTVLGTGLSFTIPAGDLLPDTAYRVYIQSICSFNSPSKWSNGAILNTRELCIKPITQPATAITPFGATFAWTNPSGTAWQVLIQPQGLPAPTADNPNWTAATSPYTATGLQPETAYDFYVRTDCGGGILSNPAGPRSFTTNVACVKPTSLTVSNPTIHGATFSWAPSASANAWQILILPRGSAAPTTSSTGWIDAPTRPFTYSDVSLTSDTSYDFYVRNNCTASGNGASLWAGPVEFTTAIACSRVTGVSSTPLNNGTSVKLSWNFDTSATVTWELLVLPFGSAPPTHNTPAMFTTNLTQYTFTNLMPETQYVFFVRGICHAINDVSRWMGVVETTLQRCYKPYYLTANNFTAHTAELSWTAPLLTQATEWQVIALPAGAPAPEVNIAGTVASTNPFVLTGLQPDTCYDYYARSNCGGDLGLSSWSIPYNFCTLPLCQQPVNLRAFNNGPDSDLSWTDLNGTTAWEIIIQDQFGPVPSDTTSGIPLSSPTYNTGALDSGYHEFYVRSICSETEKSQWSGPYSFMSPTNIPLPVAAVTITPENTSPGTIDICSGETCIDLTSHYFDSKETTTYTVLPVSFSPPIPFYAGQTFPIIDDRWTDPFYIPFEFSFYGVKYHSLVIGSNGVVTFNPQTSEDFCIWNTSSLAGIPDTSFSIKNAIYGVYQDIDPSVDTSPLVHSVNYKVIGTAPNRAFVINYYNIALYNCLLDAPLQTSQIVLYETSNIIEVYVKDRTSCPSWNLGRGVIGIQNASGTVAHFPPQRNLDVWETHNEAWRFVPNGASNTTFSWLKDGVFYNNNPAINVCITGNTTMTAQVTYPANDQTPVVVTKDVLLNIVAPVSIPTGTASQTMPLGSVLENLMVSGENIKWYDAPVNGTLLPASTPLADGVIYYASQTVNGCESPNRLAVTAHLTLSNPDFNPMVVSYNPNPVTDILDIKASATIREVKVCNTLGQVVQQTAFNGNEVELNINGLPSGTYLILVVSEDRKETLKIVKR